MHLTVYFLVDISNITGSNKITLRKRNLEPCEYDKKSMNKDLIEDKLHQLINQFNQRKISFKDSYSKVLKNVHPLYDENGKTCKIFS